MGAGQKPQKPPNILRHADQQREEQIVHEALFPFVNQGKRLGTSHTLCTASLGLLTVLVGCLCFPREEEDFEGAGLKEGMLALVHWTSVFLACFAICRADDTR